MQVRDDGAELQRALPEVLVPRRVGAGQLEPVRRLVHELGEHGEVCAGRRLDGRPGIPRSARSSGTVGRQLDRPEVAWHAVPAGPGESRGDHDVGVRAERHCPQDLQHPAAARRVRQGGQHHGGVRLLAGDAPRPGELCAVLRLARAGQCCREVGVPRDGVHPAVVHGDPARRGGDRADQPGLLGLGRVGLRLRGRGQHQRDLDHQRLVAGGQPGPGQPQERDDHVGDAPERDREPRLVRDPLGRHRVPALLGQPLVQQPQHLGGEVRGSGGDVDGGYRAHTARACPAVSSGAAVAPAGVGGASTSQ